MIVLSLCLKMERKEYRWVEVKQKALCLRKASNRCLDEEENTHDTRFWQWSKSKLIDGSSFSLFSLKDFDSYI